MREPDYDGFQSETEFLGYVAELEKKRRKHESRTPEAIRQDRCRRRRKRAENYWEHYLRTGGRPETWLDGLSESIIEAAKKKLVAKYPDLARMRGLV